MIWNDLVRIIPAALISFLLSSCGEIASPAPPKNEVDFKFISLETVPRSGCYRFATDTTLLDGPETASCISGASFTYSLTRNTDLDIALVLESMEELGTGYRYKGNELFWRQMPVYVGGPWVDCEGDYRPTGTITCTQRFELYLWHTGGMPISCTDCWWRFHAHRDDFQGQAFVLSWYDDLYDVRVTGRIPLD